MTFRNTISAFFSNRKLFLVPALLMFLPLLFTGIRTDHDWGDDFAQYLAQAENIIQGKTMTETGYIYNPEYPSLGPKAYPPGFPLLISPIIGIYGNNILPINYLISTILIAIALLSVLLLKEHTGWFSAMLLSAVIYYNPYTIGLKAEVMADIPFALLFLIFILIVYYRSGISAYVWIIAGVIAGLAISIKSIGIVLPVSLLLFSIQQIFHSWQNNKSFKEAFVGIRHYLIAASVALGVSLVFNLFFMQETAGGGYLNIYSLSRITEAFATNVYVYSEAIRMFFINPDSPFFWIGFPAGAIVLAFFTVGLFRSFFSKPELIDWITVLYIFILLIYPYHNSGFRFLLPLAPVIFKYCIETLNLITSKKSVQWIALVVSVLVLITYIKGMPGYYNEEKRKVDGPYASHVVNAFAEIAAVTSEESKIVFIKPRALARFSGRKAMSHNPLSTSLQIYNELKPLEPTHYLVYSGLPDSALVRYLQTNQKEVKLVWRDEFFMLYKNSEKH